MEKEEAIDIMKVHRKHCRNVGDTRYADALDYAIRHLSKTKPSASSKICPKCWGDGYIGIVGSKNDKPINCDMCKGIGKIS